MIRAAAVVAAAVLASLPFSSPLHTTPLDDDPALRPARGSGVSLFSLARRKEPAPPPSEPLGEPTLEPFLGTLFNLHTGESVPLGEAEPTPDRFSDLLADKGMNEHIEMAPRLLELLRTLSRAHPGARIELVSGYRSAKRNEMMRKKGRHVASHSQHVLGMAVDFRIQGRTVPQMVKEIEALHWDGGLGRYDSPSDLFVHCDVGPNRRWKGK